MVIWCEVFCHVIMSLVWCWHRFVDNISLIFGHGCQKQNANAKSWDNISTLGQILILCVKWNELNDSKEKRKVSDKNCLRTSGSHCAKCYSNTPEQRRPHVTFDSCGDEMIFVESLVQEIFWLIQWLFMTWGQLIIWKIRHGTSQSQIRWPIEITCSSVISFDLFKLDLSRINRLWGSFSFALLIRPSFELKLFLCFGHLDVVIGELRVVRNSLVLLLRLLELFFSLFDFLHFDALQNVENSVNTILNENSAEKSFGSRDLIRVNHI